MKVGELEWHILIVCMFLLIEQVRQIQELLEEFIQQLNKEK